MDKINHEDRDHALLSASGSKRWLNCTMSARLEDDIEDRSSVYAREGTFGHEVCEVEVRKYLGEINDTEYENQLRIIEKDMPKDFDFKEMIINAGYYVDKITEMISHINNPACFVEMKLDYSRWVPEGFGTSDFFAVGDHELHVVDYKYGKGVKVDATDNPQMRLYALGAYQIIKDIYNVEDIYYHVIQPRLDHVSTEKMTRKNLLNWANDYVKPRAKLAFAGEGTFKAGDHCKWCKLKGNCRERANENLKLAKYEFAEPVTLDHSEIKEVLNKARGLSKWATNRALQGEKFEGLKLIKGRSSRKIIDEAAALNNIKSAGYGEEDCYKKSFKGITDLTKLLGKNLFAEILEAPGIVISKEGKPKLVDESSKGKAYDPLAEAQKEFK